MKIWKMLFAVTMMLCFAGQAFAQTPTPDPIGETGPPVTMTNGPCEDALEYINDVQSRIGFAECDVIYLQSQFDAAAEAAEDAYQAFQAETDLEAKAALGEVYLEKVRLLTAASEALREATEALNLLRVLLAMAQWYYDSLDCWV